MSQSCPAHFPITDRNRLQRSPKRGGFDRAPIFAVIDAAPICHVGFTIDGQPFVIPTLHARQGDTLYFHGSTQSRMMQALGSGEALCITFTLLDGIVAARSAMHHSMNYRSVVAFGKGRLIHDLEAKAEAFRLTVEKLLPGRWNECRQPNQAEERATAIAAVTIDEASLKQRSGPPIDIESDYEGSHWAGVIPVHTKLGTPIPDPKLQPEMPLPRHIAELKIESRPAPCT